MYIEKHSTRFPYSSWSTILIGHYFRTQHLKFQLGTFFLEARLYSCSIKVYLPVTGRPITRGERENRFGKSAVDRCHAKSICFNEIWLVPVFTRVRCLLFLKLHGLLIHIHIVFFQTMCQSLESSLQSFGSQLASEECVFAEPGYAPDISRKKVSTSSEIQA